VSEHLPIWKRPAVLAIIGIVLAFPPSLVALVQLFSSSGDQSAIETQNPRVTPTENFNSPSPTTPIKTNLTLNTGKSVRDEIALTYFSAEFQELQGKQFAKLVAAPDGRQAVHKPIFNAGQSLVFDGAKGKFKATVLTLDFQQQRLEIKVTEVN